VSRRPSITSPLRMFTPDWTLLGQKQKNWGWTRT
jgi:hypothetical protein